VTSRDNYFLLLAHKRMRITLCRHGDPSDDAQKLRHQQLADNHNGTPGLMDT
jgi:hypothetical protein